MGAQTAGSGDIAAGVAAHGFDANQRAAKDLACCTIDSVPRPSGKGIGERTGHSAQIGNSKFAPVAADALQAHAVRGRAASSVKPVRQRREARPRLPQFGLALANFGSRNRNRDGPCLPRDPFSRLGTRYCAATRQGQKEKG